jgi:sterol desaturase/sphingolipid hydroxylase (fatty acid hydroxylase superfamily)
VDATYSRAVGLAIPVFFALIAIELAIDLARGTRYYRLSDALNSLSCGMISTGMRVFFGFLGLFAYEWVLEHCALVHLPASLWTTWVFAFVLYDLCYYWQHRFGHTVNLFWASHVVHHQSEEFNLTTALRQPGTGALVNWIFYVPMALAGVPFTVFLLVGVVQLFYQFWPHTRVIGRMGILDRLIQTPSNHRVHHAQNDIYLDRNYVGVFTIWDHLFGSFQEELDEEPPIYGIRGQLKSWNPVWANLHYYWAIALDSWRTSRWSDKLRVWFAPPGWRPADVAERFPKPEYDPRRDFARFDPPHSLGTSIYALVQTAALVAADDHFLSVLQKEPAWLNVLYFAFIVWGLVTLGGILESRREFLWLEMGRLAVAGSGLVTFGWFGSVHDPRVIAGLEAFVLLSAAGLLACLRKSTYLTNLATATRSGSV